MIAVSKVVETGEKSLHVLDRRLSVDSQISNWSLLEDEYHDAL